MFLGSKPEAREPREGPTAPEREAPEQRKVRSEAAADTEGPIRWRHMQTQSGLGARTSQPGHRLGGSPLLGLPPQEAEPRVIRSHAPAYPTLPLRPSGLQLILRLGRYLGSPAGVTW